MGQTSSYASYSDKDRDADGNVVNHHCFDVDEESGDDSAASSADPNASMASDASNDDQDGGNSSSSTSTDSDNDNDQNANVNVASTKLRKQTQTATAASSSSDLLSLTNAEIKARLEQITFTVDTIRAANQLLTNNDPLNDEIYSWYQDATSINKKDGTVSVRNQGRSHMQVAMFMLQVSPALRSFRLKVVPAKLSETFFWNAVIYLLLSNDAYADTSALNGDGNGNGVKTQLPQSQSHSQSNCKSIIAQKDEEIAQLKQKLAQARAHPPQTATTTTSHNGKWSMDKESLEFLSLDDEIKQKLRDGKIKRLADVHEQMKFILDSDHVKDSRGNWSCCGQTAYQGQCS
jgi:hypothetical protein